MSGRAKRSEAQSSESQLVGVLSRVFRHDAAAPNVMLGIGDDAACLRFTGKLVVSVDAQVEGTHFRLEWLDLKDLGFRSFQAAISDLAAMGATPVAAVSHLTLPADFRPAELRRLSLGQEQAAAATACPVIGGNLSRGSELSVVTTVLGRAKRYVTRSGARPGDEVWLLGEIGLAPCGTGTAAQRVQASHARGTPCPGSLATPHGASRGGTCSGWTCSRVPGRL